MPPSSQTPTRCTLQLASGVAMEFQWIEPGEFRMGSYNQRDREEPVHLVRITREFFLGLYPVTQNQFAVWTKGAGIEHQNEFPDKPHHPAENLDWQQANQYCEWLNREFGSQLPIGHRAALPTEAQWEFACRAGTDTEYSIGDGAAALAEAGWFAEEYGSGSTHPVGEKTPNAWGLYDMHGNVWEWCLDAWDANAYKWRPEGVADPVVTPEDVGKKDPDRVLRGGSWGSGARFCRSAFRDRVGADVRDGNLGFRVALVPGPVAVPEGGAPISAAAEPDCGDGGRGTSPESERSGAAACTKDDWRTATLAPA